MNLFIDIETIPDQRTDALDRAVNLVKVPANYKKPETIEAYKIDNAPEVHARTALNGLHGEICSIAWAFDDGQVSCVGREETISEKDVLEGFFASIDHRNRGGEGRHQHITWIGHNVIEFDLRFLKQRALVNNVRPPVVIPADARHGNQVFDTMKEWAGWRGYVKLDDLAQAFGVGGKGDIDGSMVADLWNNREYQKIRNYNCDDVVLTRKVYNRMVWRS